MKTNLFSNTSAVKYFYALIAIILFSCSKSSLQQDINSKADAQQTASKKSNLLPNGLVTTPLYRYWDGVNRDHFYTIVSGSYAGYVYEGIECWVLAGQQNSSVVPFLRYFNGRQTDHFYTTTSADYPGYVYEGVEGYVYTSLISGGNIPLYRYFNGTTVDHFYTVTAGSYPGYSYEGIAAYVLPN